MNQRFKEYAALPELGEEQPAIDYNQFVTDILQYSIRRPKQLYYFQNPELGLMKRKWLCAGFKGLG